MISPDTSPSLIDRAARAGMFRDRVHGRGLVLTAAVRVVTGLLFLSAAIPKITAHQAEIEMFGQFGLPRSSALVYLVAALEILGALLLLLGLATRPAAAVLAANMTGAILTAGIHVGGPIHLGLAPALLVAMLYLLWAGPGVGAVDRRWRTSYSGPDRP